MIKEIVTMIGESSVDGGKFMLKCAMNETTNRSAALLVVASTNGEEAGIILEREAVGAFKLAIDAYLDATSS